MLRRQYCLCALYGYLVAQFWTFNLWSLPHCLISILLLFYIAQDQQVENLTRFSYQVEVFILETFNFINGELATQEYFEKYSWLRQSYELVSLLSLYLWQKIKILIPLRRIFKAFLILQELLLAWMIDRLSQKVYSKAKNLEMIEYIPHHKEDKDAEDENKETEEDKGINSENFLQ